MIRETLKRYKLSEQEILNALNIEGDLSFINQDHDGNVILEVLIKDGA